MPRPGSVGGDGGGDANVDGEVEVEGGVPIGAAIVRVGAEVIVTFATPRLAKKELAAAGVAMRLDKCAEIAAD